MILITALPTMAGTATAASPYGIPASNPISRIAPALQKIFTCVIWHESTSSWRHLNLNDNRSDGSSSGIFQITEGTWKAWAPKVGINVPIWKATPLQQEQGAIEIYKHDGWVPWKADWVCYL